MGAVRIHAILALLMLASCDDARLLSAVDPEKGCAVELMRELGDGWRFIESKYSDVGGAAGKLEISHGDRMEKLNSRLTLLRSVDTDECAADVKLALSDVETAYQTYIASLEAKNIDPRALGSGPPIDLMKERANLGTTLKRLFGLISLKYDLGTDGSPRAEG